MYNGNTIASLSRCGAIDSHARGYERTSLTCNKAPNRRPSSPARGKQKKEERETEPEEEDEKENKKKEDEETE